MNVILKSFFFLHLLLQYTSQTFYTYTIINETLEFSIYAMLIFFVFCCSWPHIVNSRCTSGYQYSRPTCFAPSFLYRLVSFQRFFSKKFLHSPVLHAVVSWVESTQVLTTYRELAANIDFVKRRKRKNQSNKRIFVTVGWKFVT